MENTSISIIVPVYKVEESLLRRCVESLIAQSMTDIEILLVDDGCPMGSGAICEEYARQDSRIRVIHRENGGLSAARNTGLDAARGEYIAFVDGDDFIDPDFCRKMLEAATAANADVTLCSADHFRPDTGTFRPFPALHRAVYSAPEDIRAITLTLLRTVPAHRREPHFPTAHYAWAHLYRSEILRDIRFQQDLHRGEDKIFNLMVMTRCRVFCSIPDVLCHYVVNMQSLSRAFYPGALPLALFTYRLYRTLPLVANDPDFLNAHYIRTCAMVINQAAVYFLHPDNPDKAYAAAFRRFCREDVVAEAIRNADLRTLRLSKLTLCILCLKLGLYGTAAKLAKRFGL